MQLLEYYNILEVSPSASEEEIKQAFRRKARLVHPDVNSAPDAKEQFKRVYDAYKVLSDSRSRAQYGESLHPIVPYHPGHSSASSSQFRKSVKERETKGFNTIEFDLPDLSLVNDIGDVLASEMKALSNTAVEQLFNDLF